MTERRDFLKVASLMSLGLFATSDANASDDPEGGHQTADTSTPSHLSASDYKIQRLKVAQMQEFPNYHLLGTPDSTANLLGAARPQNWRSTKANLRSGLSATANPSDPIHDWLATFTLGVSDHTAAIAVNAGNSLIQGATAHRYEPQLYDALLRSGASLLDRCIRYRAELGQLEVAGVSAGVNYLAFLKMKPLQRNFLAHSNISDLARMEEKSDKEQLSALHPIRDGGQIAAKIVELRHDAMEQGHAAAKNDLLTSLLEKQFNLQSDAQLALFTRLLEPGSSSNYAERYLRILSLLTEDLSDAYLKLFAASLGTQGVLGLTSISVGLNTPVDIAIPRFGGLPDVGSWVSTIVPPQGAQRQPDVVDALVLWCRATMRSVDEIAQYESEFTVSIPLNQPWRGSQNPIVPTADISAAFSGANATGKITFNLPSNSIPVSETPTNVRVMGVGISVECSIDDASPFQFTSGFPHTPANPVAAVGQTPLPSQEPTADQVAAARKFELPRIARVNATIATPAQTLVDGSSYSRPKIFVPRVRIQGGSGGDFEPLMFTELPCRGLKPFGQWTISFDPAAVAYFQSDSVIGISWITGVILHLRLRCSFS